MPHNPITQNPGILKFATVAVISDVTTVAIFNTFIR
jgi:hypothetical protein